MGNEMGNNNTSRLREEDDTNPEVQEKSLHEPLHANDIKGDNNVVPTTESKDYHQKERGLTSDDQDYHQKERGLTSDDQNGAGKEEPEVNPSVESPEAEKKFNEQGEKDSDIEPAASLPRELENHVNQTSLNLAEKVLEMSNNQIEIQSSFKTEEEDIPDSASATISSACNPESINPEEVNSDQHELTEVHSDQSVQDCANYRREIEDRSGSSTASNSKENGHLLDNCISDKIEESADSSANLHVKEKREEFVVKEIASQEDEMSRKGKFKAEVGIENENDSSKTIIAPSDPTEVNSGEIDAKLNCNGTNFLESQLEVSLPEGKCMVLTQEAKLIGQESESADSKHDDHDSIRKSEVGKVSAAQTDPSTCSNCQSNEKEGPFITVLAAASYGICQIDLIKAVEDSGNQNEASEEYGTGSEGNVMMIHELGILEAKSLIANGRDNECGDCRPEACVAPDAASNGNCPVKETKAAERYDRNEASEEHLEGSQWKTTKDPEVRKCVDDSSISNGKNNEEESGYTKPEACTAHDAVSNGKCKEEEAKDVEVSDNQNEASEGEIMMVPEHGMPPEELAVTNDKHREEESEDLKAKEEERKEKQIAEVKKNVEAPCVTKMDIDDTKCGEQFQSQPLPVSEDLPLPCGPASLIHSEDHQQKNVMKSENAQDCNNSTLKLKPGSSSDIFSATDSSFHITSSAMKIKAELEIKKHAKEGLAHVTEAAADMVTETNSSASAYNSTEQHQKIHTTIIEKGGIQAQNEGSLSTEPIPENLIQAEDPKCQNSITESTDPAIQLRTEKPQQEVPHYNAGALEAATEANSSVSAVQFREKSRKVETSVFARGSYERQESVGRFSNESIPDYLNVHAGMRKSPSFDFDLRIEARSTDESEQTPLLYQDKNTIESLSRQADTSLESSSPQAAEYAQESFKYQAVPMEEKVITLEKTDSEKSKTPFLGFMKDDEEANAVVTPKKQEKHGHAKKEINKEVAATATPLKSKEKHKRRSFLLTNCMCCTTTVIN